MDFPKRLRSACLLLLVIIIPNTRSDESTDYNTGHELALTAFEVISPLALNSSENTQHKFIANDIMDMALEKVREIIVKENMNRIRIPDFTEPFRRDLGFIKLTGSFKGTDGWVESLLSISRRGDAIVRVDGASLVLDAPLGLNTLELGMKFDVEFLGIKPKQGEITGRVRSNNVWLSNAMDYASGECHLKILSLKITDLGKIDVDVKGYGELNWLFTQIASWVTDRAHARIQDAVNNILNEILQREINKIDCPALA